MERRSRNMTIRVSPEEYASLQEKYKKTTCRSMSEWCRDLIFQNPVTVYYRNESLDEFLTLAIAIKNELQAAGRNLNQAVKKLHSVGQTTDIKPSIEWLEAETFSLNQKAEEIRRSLIQIQTKWSQK
ncbi:MAG: plasmid mobilization relaxosome protein MobC [Bacteroidota bacterium]|nr:plasmid mobilization relaxosome protein MobC [Bacteroidota bacterium]